MDSEQSEYSGSILTGILRRVVPWIGLIVVAALVWSYLGQYRTAVEIGKGGETSGTVEATGTAGAAGQGQVRVLNDGLNLRAEPMTTAAVLKTLKKDEQLVLLERGSGWYQVRDSAGVVGWVAAGGSYTELVEP